MTILVMFLTITGRRNRRNLFSVNMRSVSRLLIIIPLLILPPLYFGVVLMMNLIIYVVMETSYKPKYFTEDELQKVSCSIADLNPLSLMRLDAARHFAGIPFVITSAYRKVETELERGRSGNSAHTRGRAFDIACSSSADRFTIVRAALEAGFTRIGIASTFIHMDDDSENLPSPRIWLY